MDAGLPVQMLPYLAGGQGFEGEADDGGDEEAEAAVEGPGSVALLFITEGDVKNSSFWEVWLQVRRRALLTA